MHRMNRATKVRIIVLIVILLLTMAIEISSGALTELTFNVSIHGRPCQVIVSQNETMYLDPEADAPRYTTTWAIEVIELDDAPITPMPTTLPTQSPTITPIPSITPNPTMSYASLKTSSVYHKSTCRYVVNRLPSELDTYATCELAIASGKRPCKSCDPCQ